MRSAFAITWMFVAAACSTTSTPRPDVQARPDDSMSARAQLEYLKGLEGDWSGAGRQGANRERIEIGYRVIAGGTAVEETCFLGTPKEMVTIYDIEDGELRLRRYSASGGPVRLVAEPDKPVPVLNYRTRVQDLPPPPPNLGPSGCEYENARAMDAWLEQMKEAGNILETTNRVDPTRHALQFASSPLSYRSFVEFTVLIHENSELSVIWQDPSNWNAEPRAFDLTRKAAASR